MTLAFIRESIIPQQRSPVKYLGAYWSVLHASMGDVLVCANAQNARVALSIRKGGALSLATGSHLAQANASQGFKTYKRWCGSVKRVAPSFADYQAREDVQGAYFGDAPAVEVDSRDAMIANLQAQLDALKGAPVATPVEDDDSVIGWVYVSKNGGREHTIVSTDGESAIADTGNTFSVSMLRKLNERGTVKDKANVRA